jgi:sulfur-carrier protein
MTGFVPKIIPGCLRREIKYIIMEVKVLFFGVLTEVTGNDSRYYKDVKSIEELNIRIINDFPGLEHYKFRISLNNQIVDADQLLSDSDEVALMPPFAGG